MKPDKQFHGKLVSNCWHILLSAAEQDGVRFQLNSGRRTEAEQRALIRVKGLWSQSNQTGAAAYSPHAPHIRAGRQDHALDVNTTDGGNTYLTRWLSAHGLPIDHEISAEPWHMEAHTEGALIRLAARLALPSYPLLRKGVVNPVPTRKLQGYLRALGYKSVRENGKYDIATRVAVRRFQRKHGISVTWNAQVTAATWVALDRRVHTKP